MSLFFQNGHDSNMLCQSWPMLLIALLVNIALAQSYPLSDPDRAAPNEVFKSNLRATGPETASQESGNSFAIIDDIYQSLSTASWFNNDREVKKISWDLPEKAFVSPQEEGNVELSKEKQLEINQLSSNFSELLSRQKRSNSITEPCSERDRGWCLQGRCLIVTAINAKLCRCPPGFTGHRCEQMDFAFYLREAFERTQAVEFYNHGRLHFFGGK